ncbi:hypothetical protein D3C81_2240690 [compost metagenome]
MLYGVKPGIVFTSLIRILPSDLRTKKSARVIPLPSIALKASMADSRKRSATSGSTGAGISICDLPSVYLAA